MNGVRIKDLVPQGFLACDLRDFLALLGDAALPLQWRVSRDVWATGKRSDELESLADEDVRISTEKLSELARAVTQVIDGDFAGYEPNVDEPWVLIRAVDSSYYEFFCDEPAVLQKVRKRFVEVSNC
jgi:hypothetical protein